MGTTPYGARVIVPITGGTFAGPQLHGTVLPGGGDWALRRADGLTVLDVRVTLRTDDDQLIYMPYRGLYSVSPEIRQRVRQGDTVDPSAYYVRMTPYFETGSEKYG